MSINMNEAVESIKRVMESNDDGPSIQDVARQTVLAIEAAWDNQDDPDEVTKVMELCSELGVLLGGKINVKDMPLQAAALYLTILFIAQ